MKNKILVTCAHPDDEMLGLGGTLALHTKKGEEISVLIFADGESARTLDKKAIVKRRKQAEKACSLLGIKKIKFLDYKDQKLDQVPILELAKKIEDVIKSFKPEKIFTHYWGDLNQDHKKVFEATMIATRPLPNSKIKSVICFETPSATEYSHESFRPNLYVEIDEKTLKTKLKAISSYEHEVMDAPHPRSIKLIENKAVHWGSHIGKKFAEAFVIVRRIEKI